VVDDEVDILEAIADVLTHEGYSVATATNGRDGLDRLAKIGRPCHRRRGNGNAQSSTSAATLPGTNPASPTGLRTASPVTTSAGRRAFGPQTLKGSRAPEAGSESLP